MTGSFAKVGRDRLGRGFPATPTTLVIFRGPRLRFALASTSARKALVCLSPIEADMPSKKGTGVRTVDARRLDELIEEAIVDCYDETEQVIGFFTMIEDHLELPFQTRVLGLEVTVVAVEQGGDGSPVAICRRGRETQRISLLDLPLPSPPPKGAEWIAAYRHWASHS
jgi:hypothetical protein